MKKITLKNQQQVPAIALGCMRIAGKTEAEVGRIITTAVDSGINFFDHADIYGGGESERVFGDALQALSLARDQLVIQTKCGIRKGYYDFSYDHIVNSVENSLRRLKTDYVDYLLLHRPDALMEPDEVAAAFSHLRASGKVRFFGVSNFSARQIELIKQATREALIFNQLQFGLAHSELVENGITVNVGEKRPYNSTGDLLDYCRFEKITIQAWSPFQYGMFQGLFWENPEYAESTKLLDTLAEKNHVSRSAMVVAWIMRHPAGIQTIIGTTNCERIASIAEASTVSLSREEWYALYLSAGKWLP